MADWVWTGTICCLYEKMGTDLFTKWRGKLSIQRSQTRSHESNSRARVREAVRSVDGKHLSVALPVSRTLWWAWLSTETSLPTSHIAQPMIFRVVFFLRVQFALQFLHQQNEFTTKSIGTRKSCQWRRHGNLQWVYFFTWTSAWLCTMTSKATSVFLLMLNLRF